jgi:hypothetical protein
MSKASFCYPNSIHSTRVAYILNDGKFIEETAIFRIGEFESGYGSTYECLFKNINIDGSGVTCQCINDNQKITLETYFRCGFCKSGRTVTVNLNGDGKIDFYPTKYPNQIDSIICDCNKSCIIIESQINAYYRESDFESKQPYRDPNAPFAAAIFGAFAGVATALTFGAAGIPLAGMAALGATTGLTPIAASVLTLGGSGAISSFINTNNNGSLTVSLPSLTVGESNNRPVNEIGVPIDLKDSDYLRYPMNTTKEDLINKLKNQSLDNVKAQYPRLFKKT